ncbi:MAG TPA: SDR family oxidoreductase [Acidimicrobiales bacterium]|jgi:NAD(P)-dependent dehydrogenase (short-subunit alcohol dehydrogenase family)|nr:SDR family oxidoreductase [Acidimicrobiales bacterium]
MAPLSDFDLSGRVVAVTGAGRGIGRAIALDVAHSGAAVAACSRTASELESLEAEIAGFGGQCKTVVSDLSTVDGVDAFVSFAAGAFGRVDALVNNAGVNLLKDALAYSEDEVDVLLNLNLKSVYFLCLAGARQMIAQGGGGSIVNITSQAGVVGAPGRAPYSAAKAGVNNLTRTLAAEWASHGIRVNAVAPTVTLTPLAEKAMADRPGFREEVAERILLGRPAEVREMSVPTVFLLSDAASMITGHVLVVDGGWTIT